MTIPLKIVIFEVVIESDFFLKQPIKKLRIQMIIFRYFRKNFIVFQLSKIVSTILLLVKSLQLMLIQVLLELFLIQYQIPKNFILTIKENFTQKT